MAFTARDSLHCGPIMAPGTVRSCLVSLALLGACASGAVRGGLPSIDGKPGDLEPPVVEFFGSPATGGGAQIELLAGQPARPYRDHGAIRVTCARGCSYDTAGAALTARARAAGLSGVHDLREVSGHVSETLESLAGQNGLVYVLAGVAFAYD